MRRTSVSLPTKQVRDAHEKPDRYGFSHHRDPGVFARARTAWMTQTQRARWIKTAIVIFLLVLLFWFFSPQSVDLMKEVVSKEPQASPGTVPKPPRIGVEKKPPVAGVVEPPRPAAEEVPIRPTTENRGQGPEGTGPGYTSEKCSRSYSDDKPLVQYVIMIDAGSTGSRIHVYKFNNCGPTPDLEHEEFKMSEKGTGLSKYKDDPTSAAHSLDMLLDVAVATVPDKLKGCSPVAVKATAGLRLVGEDAANSILRAVRSHLERDHPFPVVSEENEGVVVMDGMYEGVYAWITTNYLLKNIGMPDKSPTAAVFDLGGGSTQIVFEPTFKELASGGMPERLAEGDHKYGLDFGGAKFELYQHSHLGYGLVSAAKAIHATLIDSMAADRTGSAAADWASEPLPHPCLPPGMTTSVEVDLPSGHALGKGTRTFTFAGPSAPAPAQCRGLAERILKKDASCTLAPCSFNGVHQPSLAKTFAHEEVYIFSYFYDRTKPLGMPDTFTLREMHDATTAVCGGEKAWDVFAGALGAFAALRENPEWCLELNFMMALLHTGYEMPMDREVRIAKKIEGNELGWCLGASLPLLSGAGWSCKVKQIS